MAFFIVSGICSADEFSVTTKIKSIYMGPHYGSKVFIEVHDRPSGARPSGCMENANFDFVLDLSNEFGKEYYSALLSAYAADRIVRLQSFDDCNVYPSIPTLKTMWMK